MRKVAIGCSITVLLPCLLVIFGILYLTNLPEHQNPPQIKNGEFPFVVEYEADGKIHVIKDTVVCAFVGYDSSAWFVKPRTWDARLKDRGDAQIVILQEENNYSVLEPERLNERSRVVLNYGRAEYYMGDPNQRNMIYARPFFYYSERYSTDEKTTHNTGTKLSKKELEEKFGIKIIKFEFSKPIINKFK